MRMTLCKNDCEENKLIGGDIKKQCVVKTRWYIDAGHELVAGNIPAKFNHLKLILINSSPSGVFQTNSVFTHQVLTTGVYVAQC